MDDPKQQHATLLWRLTGSGQWERALETARAWLSQDPENSLAHLGAGQALVNLHQYPLARKHLEKALQREPRHDGAHRLISIAFFHEKNLAAAEEHVQTALAIDPTDAGHWYHLAWLRYQCGAPDAAAKHARHALELRPNDANTINLLALCRQGKTGGDGPELLAQYQRALEFDPENETVHNNMGTYYLDAARDYAKAEECFRRALMFSPSFKTAQENLFVVLRRRDPVYRALVFPRTLFARLAWRRSDGSALGRVGALLGLIFAVRFLSPLILLWLGLIYPLVKVYEYLTLGDIRARAGMIGGRRGGLFGFWRWSFAARFGVFVGISLLFWGVIASLFYKQWLPDWVLGLGLCAGMLAWLGYILRGGWRRSRRAAAARRGEKRLNRRMAAEAAARAAGKAD